MKHMPTLQLGREREKEGGEEEKGEGEERRGKEDMHNRGQEV